MFSREASDRLALYASVAMHALLLSALLRQEASLQIYLPPLPLSQAGTERVGIILQDWIRKQQSDREDDSRWNRFGDPDGKGYAINSSPGEDLLYGREGDQDQAWLSRDPVGPGPMPEEPSPSTALPGDGGTGGAAGPGGRPGRPGSNAPTPSQGPKPAIPFGVSDGEQTAQPTPRIPIRRPPTLIAIIPPAPRPELIGVGPLTATTQPARQATPATLPSKPLAVIAVPKPVEATPAPNAPSSTPSPASPPQPALAQAGNGGNGGGGGGGRPGPPVPPADPAPMSDSESDPFARVGSITVRAGKVEARLGRAHKLIKPRLTIKAQIDLHSIANPSVVLKVSIDKTGKVTNVEVLRSSGSNEIDLPTTLALYKSWIEPRKDKNGNPIPDIVAIVFTWR